ncbi:MopE-related protein, partial [Algibacter sp.]|nr:MopE-related protein [Algibacter sp.]
LTLTSEADSALKAKTGKVNVCHYDADTDTWKTLNINGNALDAHLNHGDVSLVDADGDGYVVDANECGVPSGDCDDTNADINPEAEEICGNEFDENCDGIAEECEIELTYVPDNNFETYLETHDQNLRVVPLGSLSMGNGILNDDYVTTSKINKVLKLVVLGKSISDLTGIEDFTSLTSLDCSRNKFTSLNISNNVALTVLECYGNQLTSLNLKNGNNSNLYVDLIDSPSLNCVEVDNPTAEESGFMNFQIDYGITFREDCEQPLQIGDYYGGGIIFYLDESGNHGLAAFKEDYLASTGWGCPFLVDGANGKAIGTGIQNTIDIVNSSRACGEAYFGMAAEYCDNLNVKGYSDWFLPSLDEANLMVENIQYGKGAWTSTQSGTESAYTAGGGSYGKAYPSYVVAVRAF